MRGTIMLIDAYAQIYRGFYALPLMSNSNGEYSNAVFAITRFLLNLEKEYNPEFGAFVFDKGKPAHRMEILPEYKANRAPMPDEMRSQLNTVREIIEAFGYPILENEGSEADDLIAALAVQFAEYKVNIISADKDIAQVIDDRVEMLVPGNKNGLQKRGVQEVIEKFEVKPEQIVDYLAMIGDVSDNIIGLAGVGPKTAAKLINQFGSIEAMLKDINAIDNDKLREKIADSAARLLKNIQLIKLDLSLPDNSWKNNSVIKKNAPDWDKIRAIAEKMELRSILKELDEISPPPSLFDDLPNSNRKLSEKLENEKNKEEDQSSMFTPDMFN